MQKKIFFFCYKTENLLSFQKKFENSFNTKVDKIGN